MRLSHRPFLIVLATCLTACQSYTRSPLDIEAHHSALAARDPSSDAVMAYVKEVTQPPTTTPYSPADGLSLPEAEVVALFFNPQLRVARLRASVTRVSAAEAGRWQDPELAVDGERIIESVQEPWVLLGSVSFTVPLSGRLGVEKKQARAEVSAAELRALAEERRLLAELRAAWIEWSAARERAALTRQVIQEMEGFAEQAEQLRKAGELDPVDAGLLQIEVVKWSGELRKFDAQSRGGEMQLKTKLGLLPGAKVQLVPALSISSVMADDDVRPEMVSEHPRVRAAQAEYEVAERTLELEVRQQYPDLKLGGGFGTDQGDERVLFGAALPLPLLNANRRAIAEARANRELARAGAEAAYEELFGDASAVQVQLEAADARVRYVERELAPLADRQVRDAQRVAKAGELNPLVLLEALRTAHQAKLEVLDARVELALAQSRLQALLEGAAAVSTSAPTTAPGTTMPTTTISDEVQP